MGGAFNLQRKFERLHISRDNMSSSQVSGSDSLPLGGLGKKRTFRELERWDIEEEKNTIENKIDGARSFADFNEVKNSEEKMEIEEDVKSIQTLKFNKGLLCKASAAVDLISQKIEFKNMMNQSVSGTFVTVILELTHDFISKLEK